jgi:hypothetical protein
VTPQLRILALIHIVVAAVILVGGLGLVIILASGAQDAHSRTALQFVGPLYLLVGLTVLPSLVGGLGLLRRRAWARWVIAAVSVPYLFALPVGTALGVFSLWALFGSGAPTRQPAGGAAVADRPSLLRRDQVNLLLVIAGTGAAIAIALNIGFKVHSHSTSADFPVIGPNGVPVPIDHPLVSIYRTLSAPTGGPHLWTGYVLLAIALGGLAALLSAKAPAMARAYNRAQIRRRQVAEFARKNAGRIAALRADPARGAYAARVASGESWSDEQIDYDRDAAAVTTCVHLQPVEAAMRRAGVLVRLIRPLQVDARCRIDEAALNATGLLTPPATYWGYYESGRSYEDNPTSRFDCKLCPSARIWVVHPKALEVAPGFDGVRLTPEIR